MVCRGNKKRNAASKQYKTNNQNMQSYSTTNKIHQPQYAGGNVSMQTRNPSGTQPQYQQQQYQQQPAKAVW